MNKSDYHTQKEIEKLERWLSGFETPAPSSEVVRLAKSAARRELHGQLATASIGKWKAWHGSIAAAAAILLAVGIGWYSQSFDVSRGTNDGMGDAIWTFASLPERSQEDTIRLAHLDEALMDVETWTTDLAWGADGASMYELMEEALTESDEEPQSLSGPGAQSIHHS